MICRNCNKDYDDEYRFCPFCGAEKEWLWCPKCSFADPTYSFCPRCGEKLITYDKYEENMIEIVKNQFQSLNIQEYLIKKIKESITFKSEIYDWVHFKDFEPMTKLDMEEYIKYCIPEEFEFTEEMKNELINGLNDDKILTIDELNKRIIRKKEEKEKWKVKNEKDIENAHIGKKMADLRKYNKDLYG